VSVFSSHFARRTRENVTLHWRLRGVDSTGWVHEDLARGSQPIDFPHYQVRIAQRIRLRMPERTMLCRLWVGAVAENGDLVARNYIEFFVDAGFPAVEQNNGARILRSEAHRWSASKWTGESSSSEAAQSSGSCYAVGHGYFGWRFAVDQRELARIESIRVLCEASARRDGTPQTDTFAFPTTFRMLLNDVPIYTAVLPNHPHDATGSLTYLRGGRGAYGYLAHAAVDGALLEQVLTNSRAGGLRLRCAVPAERTPHGGLTIYGGDCGRYPIPPTLIVTLKPE
jgi:hypothetical protein